MLPFITEALAEAARNAESRVINLADAKTVLEERGESAIRYVVKIVGGNWYNDNLRTTPEISEANLDEALVKATTTFYLSNGSVSNLSGYLRENDFEHFYIHALVNDYYKAHIPNPMIKQEIEEAIEKVMKMRG